METSEKMFRSVWKEGGSFRAEAKRQARATRRDNAVGQRRAMEAEQAKRRELLPLVAQECARIKSELDSVNWQGCVRLKILRVAFGSFGKKLGAYKLEHSPHGMLLPWYFATDGNFYCFMRSDMAEGYGKVRLDKESALSLQKLLDTLRATSIN